MSNSYHPHGHFFAHPVRFAWLLLCLVALLLSACQSPAAAATSAPATQPPNLPEATIIEPTDLPVPANASVLPDDPLAAVTYAMLAQPKGIPYSVLTTIDTGSTQMKTMVEIESPQRILVVSPSGSVKMVDGQCFEMPTGESWHVCANPKVGDTVLAAASTFLDESTIYAFIATIKTVKLIGNETLDGIPSRIYEYTYSSDQFGLHVEGTTQLWVAEDDGLPIKQVTNSTTGGYSATSIQSIDYSPSLTVRAP